MAFWQNHLGNRTHRHQNNRNQRRPDADAKARHLFFRKSFRAVQAFWDRLIDAFQETGVNRSGKDHGRDRQNRTKQQRLTHIGMENRGDCGWTRVRRQEAVCDGERRGHRHADVQ
ncbi:Uncharacterised protein [Salmonella enterica subsp. enterica serovar Bovismorbificans]|uniref:Uncharacterized protein n=1 Tax=Salmonella enterica subsp. enterica serovar Bovismorbificans TaxID=58097 RepID=A0A655DXS7_SALET|nr:Uncharacterised protein [Salmonella enterica subsp. enterica serovar Bovismorbificans]CNU27149.1 Uncharacterised protein [Salmonella enterica subsp. enterica serovar Bovismorbificans]CNU93072.1 Uncharacterised protein [Salmonella enterica subsp. enterica serovar Bovismorbificans]